MTTFTFPIDLDWNTWRYQTDKKMPSRFLTLWTFLGNKNNKKRKDDPPKVSHFLTIRKYFQFQPFDIIFQDFGSCALLLSGIQEPIHCLYFQFWMIFAQLDIIVGPLKWIVNPIKCIMNWKSNINWKVLLPNVCEVCQRVTVVVRSTFNTLWETCKKKIEKKKITCLQFPNLSWWWPLSVERHNQFDLLGLIGLYAS